MISFLSFLSPAFGLLGTIVLAFSVNPILESIKTMLKVQEDLNKFNYENEHNKIVITGVDRHLEKFGSKSSNHRVLIGISLMGLSYFLQVVILLIY